MASVGDVAIKKIIRQISINVPNGKKIDLIKSNMLTKENKTQTHSTSNCDIQLTNKQCRIVGSLDY